ncbi:polysaccharide deacetylase family protein [Acrocarpospora catenulata]|uniref:polysaccharide deacetylase family protein n=1 Tax=Acrocarpospora catenulata TaxID=2836182 RepID=UPI002023A955|nr:polysaccharide deacetylase family protein [Acrocarpospora catenulata]
MAQRAPAGRPSPQPPPAPPMMVDPDILARQLTGNQPGWPISPFPRAPLPRLLDCVKLKCVALTFDDGPMDATAEVLDTLAAHQAKATFFVVGQMVSDQTSGLLRRMVEEGHELGNHSWDHPNLTGISADSLRMQLESTQQVVQRYTGVKMTVMRPPYGATDQRVAAATKREGLAQILWGLDTLDWRDRNADLVARRAAMAEPGDVVLMHDIHRTTIDAVPKLLDALDGKGFTYVTVSELFGEMDPGREYFDKKAKPAPKE